MNESTIIPEKLQYQLFALRDVDTNNSWRLGDLTAEIIQYNDVNNTGASLMEIYKAVGSVAGRASRTVREYHLVSTRFTPDVRQQYDVLAFGHFRIASRLPDPIKALEWAVDQFTVTGKPATIDAMELMFGEPEAEPRDEVDPLERILNIFGAIRDYVSERKDKIPNTTVERIWRNCEVLEGDLRQVAVAVKQ
jgi:hypothetical protein